jgi:two-component system, cell cycle sensor histidine kinase and response regulator CckA
MTKPLRILIVEDSEEDALLLLMELRRNGYETDFARVETREAMKEALQRRECDVVISDYVMPKFSGLEALATLKESGLDLPFVIVSGNIGEDIAVEAMKAGAHDYILKGNLKRLVPAIERELRDAETRRARRRVEEERTRLATAVEAAIDAVVITDPHGTIRYVNPAFEKITGHSREEVDGQELSILEGGKNSGPFPHDVQEAIRKDEPWTGRLTGKRKDGTLYEEECTYAPIKAPSGEIVNHLFIKRDITEKLRLESVAQAVDTMNNIGYIFSGVRHEIGNPVNAVIMNLSLLKAKLETADKTAIEKYVDRALASCEKVEYLLRSLRSFNLYEKPDLDNLDMEDFVKKFISLVNEDFEKRGITIDTIVDPVRAYADARVLQQVLLNLFTNAADALKERADPSITVNVSPAGKMVRIRVHDNGNGIPEDRLKNLFKPFHTSKSTGTGLGLVIVKKMITMMNGTVVITSTVGKGTNVDIFIPAGRVIEPSER